ncbi:MAG: hypothetical protein K940chlam7_01641 [Chlamydiae bacterium]|nr:hypothetical protein [Chlamydiota bacterium]
MDKFDKEESKRIISKKVKLEKGKRTPGSFAKSDFHIETRAFR